MTTSQVESAAMKAAEITKSVVNNCQADMNSTVVFQEVFARLLAATDDETSKED